jgi:hypothetical protein
MNKFLRWSATISVTVAILQACVGCTVAKNKQTRSTVTDSLSKTTIRDSIIYHTRETEQGRDVSQYERVTTISPTIIRDSNIIRVYPTTVIRETGERVIEYRRDSSSDLLVVRLQATIDSLSRVDKESVKHKHTTTSWKWPIIIALCMILCLWLAFRRPIKKPV